MARSFFAILLVTCLAFTSSVALQVSPNSQCAAVCQDAADQDKSDPMQSNTVGSDIVCHDKNYATPVGQKFKRCVECLQESSDKSTTESDLQWFLYNIRFAVTSCVYGLANASDPLSSPCSISTSCGPLVGALQDGLDVPLSDNRFSYCSAFGGTFLGPRLGPCTRCLQLTEEQKYMGNFMVALKAACTQKPDVGKIVGLDGSLFSKTPVNATTEAAPPPTTSVSQDKGGLTTGAYAGIGIAGAFIIAALAAMCYVGWRKKQAREKRDQIASGLDDRFGNGRITMPVSGAYGDPHQSQHSPYQNVGMVTVPTRSEKPYSSQRNGSQSHEEYYPNRSYQRPLSTYSQHQHQHEQAVREVGAVAPYAPYNPSRVESPAPAYSPALSLQRDTPTHSPSSIADSTTRLHHPLSSNETSNVTRSHPVPSVGEPLNLTRPNVVGGNVPGAPALPARSNSIATGSPAFTPRPARHTKDLSVGRETDNRSNISGPMITVSTRFDVDDEAKKKAERQRLYQLGFKAKDQEKTKSPDEEMWPGNY